MHTLKLDLQQPICQLSHHLLTLFELDPDPSIVLNLLDHLSVPADDDANSKSGHNHLERKKRVQIRKTFLLLDKEGNKCPAYGKTEGWALTSRLLPPILDPKSALPALKSPWSLSRISFTTSSRACYRLAD